MVKVYMGDQVKSSAAGAGLTAQDTELILKAYRDQVFGQLLTSTQTVPFLGVCELTSSSNGFSRGLTVQPTLAYQLLAVSQSLGIPLDVVRSAVTSYREDLIDQLIANKHVNVNQLVTLRLTDAYRLRSNTTEVFKDRHGVQVRCAIVRSFKRQFAQRLEKMGLTFSLDW